MPRRFEMDGGVRPEENLRHLRREQGGKDCQPFGFTPEK